MITVKGVLQEMIEEKIMSYGHSFYRVRWDSEKRLPINDWWKFEVSKKVYFDYILKRGEFAS